MANITLKNVPDALYERLKGTAERNRRSLNSEVILRLERSLGSAPVDADALLARARAVRERLAVSAEEDEALQSAIEGGRT